MPASTSARILPSLLWLVVGVALLAGGMLVPVNFRAVPPALLAEAGLGTTSLERVGGELLDLDKPGPAALVRDAANAVGAPGTLALAERWQRVAGARPDLIPWGGWDPFLEPFFSRDAAADRKTSTPVLTFFITQEARDSLGSFLAGSRSSGVRLLLRTREIDRTKQFVPARRPGGQALDAVVLLSALLYQGEHFSTGLQREVRALAADAVDRQEMGPLEDFYINLLSLGKRLDWIQLAEFLRYTDSVQTVAEFAHLTRVAKDHLPIIYSAALLTRSADRVAAYSLRYGTPGLEDLQIALRSGQGGVDVLLKRQAPINRSAGPTISGLAAITLLHPALMLMAKYSAFFFGAFCGLRGLATFFFRPGDRVSVPLGSSAALAVLATAMLVLGTEPFLLNAAPTSDLQLRFTVPVLGSISDPSSLTETAATTAMDTPTLLSIAFFACLQVTMYLICLLKIRAIDRQDIPPALKLDLMVNEENLFDGGLYVGIGGTATALVLQVLGFIEPNLLAAYSSNLFGISCVAIIKIIHVRRYKMRLIMESRAVVTA